MHTGDEVERVRRLSDGELLAGLSSTLGSSRKWAALVLVHLAEVEERRLHLLAGYGSLFAYCTVRLRMSEDEACRRIAVAQLARRFPILYEGLAGGAISLSVAGLLKQHLTDANCAPLLRALSGKTVGQAREVLATWFPQPDVPSSIRKLPERPGTASANGDVGSDENRNGIGEAAPVGPAPPAAVGPARPAPASARIPLAEPLLSAAMTPEPPSAARARASSAIEPLSPERYKIVFTADAELKRKLELARDLLRHAVPSGDLAAIMGRALDLLLDDTLRRRFAKTKRSRAAPRARSHASTPASEVAPPSTTARDDEPGIPVEPAAPMAEADASSLVVGCPGPSDTPARLAAPTGSPLSRHLPASVRRTVVDRDGLRCTWRGPDGTRCESRAWLEHDHIDPRGKGGGDGPSNIRLCCRAHNRLAAEQTYGRRTIARIIARRRGRQHPGVETHGDFATAPAGPRPTT